MGGYKFDGIDPDRMRDLSNGMTKVIHELNLEPSVVKGTIEDLMLEDVAGQPGRIFDEILQELGLLADFAMQKAADIENAAQGGQSTSDTSAADKLLASLNDGLGADGLDGATDDAAMLDAINDWIRDNPRCSAADLRKKMDEAARAGNQDAVDALSRALWARIAAMDNRAEIDQYLHDLGDDAVVLAVESIGFPPGTDGNGASCEAVSNVYTQLASAKGHATPVDADSEIGIYLMQRFGVDANTFGNYAEAAAARLLEAAARDEASAIGVANAIVNYPLSKNPRVAAVLRAVLKANPSVLAFKLSSKVTAQKVADIIAEGATDEELAELQGKLAAWVAERMVRGPGKDFNLDDALFALETYGNFAEALANVGHNIGKNWDVVWDVVAAVLDTKLGGAASSILAVLRGLVAPDDDDIYSKRSAEDRAELEKKNTAMLLLALADPQAAAELAWVLERAGTKTGEVSPGAWDNLTGYKQTDEYQKMSDEQKAEKDAAINVALSKLVAITEKL